MIIYRPFRHIKTHIHTYIYKNTSSEYLKRAATCYSSAEYYYSCSCGLAGEGTFTSGSTLEHEYSPFGGREATCTVAGYDGYSCSLCGKYTEVRIPATGHSWEDATCTEPKTCSKCGETEGEALSHSWTLIGEPQRDYQTGTCTHSVKCDTCDTTANLDYDIGNYECNRYCTGGCSWVDHRNISYGLEYTEEPTCTTAGKTYRYDYCLDCNTELNKTAVGELPATGHTWTNNGTIGYCESCGQTCSHQGEPTYEGNYCDDCGLRLG